MTLTIVKEKAGVISPNECWVAFCQCWMYTANTFDELMVVLNSEWQMDRHLVG